MRFAVLLLGLLVWFPASGLHAQEVYKNGRYTVRKVQGACKLEILLHQGDRQAAAILALFPSERYYGELFTEKKRIGKARNKAVIQFDNESTRNVAFVPDASAEDDFWRWQYLENTQGLLSLISRKMEMKLSFYNGKEWYRYSVSLKGSSKAVLALRQCR